MKNTLTYHEQICSAWNREKKNKNAEGMVYYEGVLNCLASVAYSSFKGSWAYNEWKNKPEVLKRIKAIEDGWKQFDWL